jgi:hypothetical protein
MALHLSPGPVAETDMYLVPDIAADICRHAMG